MLGDFGDGLARLNELKVLVLLPQRIKQLFVFESLALHLEEDAVDDPLQLWNYPIPSFSAFSLKSRDSSWPT